MFACPVIVGCSCQALTRELPGDGEREAVAGGVLRPVDLSARLIDAGVNEISRQVRTRQITAGNTSEVEFKRALCSQTLMAIFNCEKLSVDVRTIATFEKPAEPPVLDDGQLDTTGFGFAPGGRSTINVIRVYYDWPTILDWGNIAKAGWGAITGAGMGNNGYRRIVGSAAFLNEP